jgi:hypothetical protein
MVFIGSRETKDDQTFGDRVRKSVPKCTDRKHKWAEVKTSLLLQELTKNEVVSKQLVSFMTRMIDGLAVSIPFDKERQLTEYLEELRVAKQFSRTRQYPVAQSNAWLGNRQGFSNNFYALLNYVKWIWIELKTSARYFNAETFTDPKMGIMNSKFAINFYQQNFFSFIQILRGNRLDDKEPYGYNQITDQMGISSFFVPSLKRTVKDLPDFVAEPWKHAGQVCHVPYWGKFGQLIKSYNDENEFYGSVKCGISASTQYIIFMYLLSLSKTKSEETKSEETKSEETKSEETKSEETKNDVRDLVTMLCLYLAGDGGHNIREILFGLTSTATLFNALIEDVTIELEDDYKTGTLESNISESKDSSRVRGPILESMAKFTDSCIKSTYGRYADRVNSAEFKKAKFDHMLELIPIWKPVITELYNITNDINIVGVTIDEIRNNFNIDTEEKLDNLRRTNRKQVLENLFNTQKNEGFLFSEMSMNTIQIFHALDNNRCNLDLNYSFKEIANTKMLQIVTSFGDGSIINTVNGQLEVELNRCSIGRAIPENPVDVPFAFTTNNGPKDKSQGSCSIS